MYGGYDSGGGDRIFVLERNRDTT